MKIGIIVDGQAEYRSLPNIFSKLETQYSILKALYADLQPGAQTVKIIRAALPSIRILARKGVQRIIVLLDHEGRSTCIPTWRTQLEEALAGPCKSNGVVDVKVVLKASMYENWLVSDPSAMRRLRQRFTLSDAHERHITPDKADRVDALGILKASAQGSAYHKVSDAVKIMTGFDPLSAGSNSRSFRRFLRLAGTRTYAQQSKLPA